MALQGKDYTYIIKKEFRWNTWACPKTSKGKIDHKAAMTGDDLSDFVNLKLFPYLKNFKASAATPDTLEYKIGEIFSELKNKIVSGYNMREILNYADGLHFQASHDKHEMSHLYESKIHKMGNAGRNGGEYYTPRPLIRTMIRILDPKLGETFYDGACGSGGFLCEAFNYMNERSANTADKWETLQKRTFFGGEVKSLAYVTAQMNCILHGLETPNIQFGSSLAQNPATITNADRVDVIGANPPFGAKVEAGEKANFTTRSSESAYLFMEHFVAKLKENGRAAIIIKNTLLSNTDNASKFIRQLLLEQCRLEMILDLPQKVFAAGVKAVVLFFRKGGPTTKPIKYYELDMKGVSLGKTRPLRESDLAEFEAIAKGKKGGKGVEAYWEVKPEDIDKETFDLSVKNPNKKAEQKASAAECRAEIQAVFAEIGEILKGWK